MIARLIGLPRPVQYAIGALLALTLLWAGKALYDRSVVREHEAKVEAAAAAARQTAADQRASDAAINTANEKDLHNAIDQAPEGRGLSPAAHALACERLRKIGRVPAACGHPGRDGNQAPAE